ncbi:MAG: mismatch repair protein MutL [Candidatus Binatota bacterium]|nr:mismatch repair protein MutL [Candidatus Binatota bacterium]
MPSIEVLPESVARRIAAGEVIERPVSVVKELVENALDAGARAITVEIEEGGRRRIAVADDGEGMTANELPIAFRPHATSKIRSVEDLLAISTLGFRGEALPSIAAVAEVETWTRRRGAAAGTRIRLRAGERLELEDAAHASGTRIEVRDLFFNTPARRKFLKSAAGETAQIAQLVGRVALSHPEVGFTLLQDGRTALSLPPGDLRARIRRVLGREIEGAMRPLTGSGVDGFVTHSQFTLPSARHLIVFVNRRFVRDRMLTHALLAAYATRIPHGRYPAAVAFLEVSPDEIDVNVHPSKLEVRFRKSGEVYDNLARAVRAALADAAPDRVADAERGYGLPVTTDVSASPSAPTLRLVDAAPADLPEASLFPAAGRYGSLRVVGQLFQGYLVCEGDGEIVLVDQHAAHERVAFERLCAERRAGRLESQALLVPVTVETAPGEAEVVAAAAEDLARSGLDVEPFGEDSVVVRSVPALFRGGDVAGLVRAVAAELAEDEPSAALEDRANRILATIACHSVVRVGQQLSEAEIRSLLEQMDGAPRNASCPHGRPVSARLSRTDLERLFRR